MTTAPHSPAPSPSATTKTLDVPGARLHYEVRGAGPVVVLVGAPMDATSFAPLADLLAVEHTVLTTDPRGINRSTVADLDADSTPDLRAHDLSRLLAEVGAGPAYVFGSSGGAVTALALAQARPDQVHAVVAHEPPLEELLDDRDELRARTDEMIARHGAGDVVGAWRLFMTVANIDVPGAAVEEMFGGPRPPQVAADDRFQFAHMLRSTTRWQPDLAQLRSATTRVVVGLGDESAGQLCARTSTALAAALGTRPNAFPGGHIGFTEDVPAFADRLRAVLGAIDRDLAL